MSNDRSIMSFEVFSFELDHFSVYSSQDETFESLLVEAHYITHPLSTSRRMPDPPALTQGKDRIKLSEAMKLDPKHTTMYRIPLLEDLSLMICSHLDSVELWRELPYLSERIKSFQYFPHPISMHLISLSAYFEPI